MNMSILMTIAMIAAGALILIPCIVIAVIAIHGEIKGRTGEQRESHRGK